MTVTAVLNEPKVLWLQPMTGYALYGSGHSWFISSECRAPVLPDTPDACCDRSFPEYDVRYSTVEPLLCEGDYVGAREGWLYGAIARSRISTGESLPPLDLPLVNP